MVVFPKALPGGGAGCSGLDQARGDQDASEAHAKPGPPVAEVPTRSNMSPLARRVQGSDEPQHHASEAALGDTQLPDGGRQDEYDLWTKEDAMFDAHARLFDYFQHSEGIGVLVEVMDQAGVAGAVVTGRPLKKSWSDREERRTGNPFADDDPLYYFSLTDTYVMEAVRQLPAETSRRFVPFLCGFDPRDRSAGEQIESLFHHYPCWGGLGEVIMGDPVVLTLAPKPHPSLRSAAFNSVLQVAANRRVPITLRFDSRSAGSGDHELEDMRWVLDRYPMVKVLWVGGGLVRSSPSLPSYLAKLESLLSAYAYLCISITPEVVRQLRECGGTAATHNLELVLDLVARNQDQVMLGSSVQGRFSRVYLAEIKLLRSFVADLPEECRHRVLRDNARKLFSPAPKLSGSRSAVHRSP